MLKKRSLFRSTLLGLFVMFFSQNIHALELKVSSQLFKMGDKLYFSSNDSESGNELWVSDGTLNGTKMIKDIYAGKDKYGNVYSSRPDSFTVMNNKLYFSADNENGRELWVSDGTDAGTKMVKDIYAGKNKSGYAYSSSPNSLTVINNKLYFSASDENGRELWVSDGTDAGTKMVKDIYAGKNSNGLAYSSHPDSFTVMNNKLYFGADNGSGKELWVSDGTLTGTKMVKDIYAGKNIYRIAYSSHPDSFTVMNNKLYFSASNANGKELWVSDGTLTGTKMVKDIYAGKNSYGSVYSSIPMNLTVINNKLYFSASDENGQELWVSDGTDAGTKMVKDIFTGKDRYSNVNSSNPNSLTVMNNKLYFRAKNASGHELWVSDGTDAGTKMVKDIYAGINTSNPTNLTLMNNKLYFSARDLNGEKVWVSDGTDAGTKMVKNTTIYYSPSNFTVMGDKLYFTAKTKNDRDSGYGDYDLGYSESREYGEIFVTDGTDESIQNITKIIEPVKVEPIVNVIRPKVWQMVSVPQGFVVDTSKLTEDLELDSYVWTVENGKWIQSPTNANAKNGLWIKPKSETINWKANSTANADFDYADKAAQLKDFKCSTKENEWRLAGVQHTLTWTDMISSNITPDEGCSFSFVFYYDKENNSWNSTENIPAHSAVWLRHVCESKAVCK